MKEKTPAVPMASTPMWESRDAQVRPPTTRPLSQRSNGVAQPRRSECPTKRNLAALLPSILAAPD